MGTFLLRSRTFRNFLTIRTGGVLGWTAGSIRCLWRKSFVPLRSRKVSFATLRFAQKEYSTTPFPLWIFSISTLGSSNGLVPHTASSVYRTIKAPIQSHRVVVAKCIVQKPDASTQGRENRAFGDGSKMDNLQRVERKPKLLGGTIGRGTNNRDSKGRRVVIRQYGQA